MIESDKVTIYPDGARSRPHKELIQIDTTHVLFILCGAFVGLEKVIKQRTTPGSIGWFMNIDKETKVDVLEGNKYNDLIEYVTHEIL